MPRQLALTLCISFIGWLFYRDRSHRPMTSGALWLVLLWIFIIGSRPASQWLGIDMEIQRPAQYLEGSPFDRNVFLIMIIAALAVLVRRRVDWNRLLVENRWPLAFFIYCLVSILWSDHPFVSFKRWTKEIGTIIMVLILLTEKDPVKAAKAVLARFTYLALPLSILVIKYFPEIGRYYNNYTWKAAVGGITTNKNTLGSVLIICGVFLVWDMMEARSGERGDRQGMLMRITLLLMVFWLLLIAESSTAIVCFVLGACIVFFMRFPAVKQQVRHLGTWSAAVALVAILLFSFPGLTKSLVKMLGRDVTFTGRTEIWSELLKAPVNPLVGAGYQSFWLGKTVERMWEKFQFHPNQAHNGYLETYLNIGLIGLGLLVMLIVSAGRKLKQDILNNDRYGVFRFSILFISLLYNWTEATFGGINLIWMIVLMAALRYPCPASPGADEKGEPRFARYFRRADPKIA